MRNIQYTETISSFNETDYKYINKKVSLNFSFIFTNNTCHDFLSIFHEIKFRIEHFYLEYFSLRKYSKFVSQVFQ